MRFLTCAFLLTQTLAIAAAVEGAEKAHIRERDDGTRTGREPGADHVEAAMVELAKIHSPQQPKKKRKSGMFAAASSYVLKAVPSLRASAPPSAQPAAHKTISGPLLEAVNHLETAAQAQNPDALYLLAQMSYYGNYSHPRDFRQSFSRYSQLADLNGNSSALYMMGLMYSTGIGGTVEADQAKALLYYTFAATRGHVRAEMTVANRHWTGVGTPKNCETACKYYKRVADKVMDWYRSGPPGGMSWARESSRVADDFGGLYGEGASASSSGMNAIHAPSNSDAYASIDDIIEYLDLMSNKGDFKATFNLGRIYYEGQRGLGRNLGMAKKYFFEISKKFWTSKGKVVPNPPAGLDKVAGKAAGYVGRMYLRGEDVAEDYDRARYWFERGIALADPQSQHGLGLMLLEGLGVGKNLARALELFKASADQDYGPSQVELGILYLDQGGIEDVRNANDYFELAARQGNIVAQYYLAELTFHGIGRDKACPLALDGYKRVAEKAEPLVSSWTEANQAYDDGDYELALLGYLHAAEEGYETAQNNVAYLLDPAQSILTNFIGRRSTKTPNLDNPELALIEWTRSSRQGNVDSLVKMGDYYLQGLGASADVDKSVKCYTGAAEHQQSAQALYNLGWMHENGIGLDQDFHLAKRYYDLALETNEEAYLPVTLSLYKLRIRSAWNTFTHGRVNSIQDEPEPHKDWSLSEWIANFIQDDGGVYDYDGMDFDDLYEDMPGGDGDMYGDELADEGLMDTTIILGLAAALAIVLWYRQQRQAAEAARRRREQQDADARNRVAQAGVQAAPTNAGPLATGVEQPQAPPAARPAPADANAPGPPQLQNGQGFLAPDW